MKLRNRLEVLDIADEHLAFPMDDSVETFQGAIILNEPAALIINSIKNQNDFDTSELVRTLVENYDVDREVAIKDVNALINSLREEGLVSD